MPCNTLLQTYTRANALKVMAVLISPKGLIQFNAFALNNRYKTAKL